VALRLHWIETPGEGRLAICARPSAEWFDLELAQIRAEGVDTVVSLLEPSEEAELGLEFEGAECATQGLAYFSLPIPDRGLPADARLSDLSAKLEDQLRRASAVVIHCRAGIGRSSVVAACVLARLGVAAEDALERISAARGLPVPDTDEQRALVLRFAAD
jgi:protein-tyrosine phosphatase